MDELTAYLLEGDPAIRWQVLRDLTDASADEVAAERARVATEGWGAQLLAEQAADGLWDGGVYRPGWADENRPMYDAWTATHFSLQQLVDYGVDPQHPKIHRAIARVRDHVRWDYGEREPYFHGETEACVNGIALRTGSYFGQDCAPIVAKLLAGQLDDGGWNCWDDQGAVVGSLHSTICVLEGLFAWERATGGSPRTAAARRRGEEYLLDRRLLFRRSTGSVIDPRFAMLSYPTRWYYDVLRALDYLRLARPERDARCADAVELLRAKRRGNGLFALENTHEGPTLFRMTDESEGFASRWVTLRALRVLHWWDGA